MGQSPPLQTALTGSPAPPPPFLDSHLSPSRASLPVRPALAGHQPPGHWRASSGLLRRELPSPGSWRRPFLPSPFISLAPEPRAMPAPGTGHPSSLSTRSAYIPGSRATRRRGQGAKAIIAWLISLHQERKTQRTLALVSPRESQGGCLERGPVASPQQPDGGVLLIEARTKGGHCYCCVRGEPGVYDTSSVCAESRTEEIERGSKCNPCL